MYAWQILGRYQTNENYTLRYHVAMKRTPDGTRKDFYDLLDRACTTTVAPESRRKTATPGGTRKQMGKPVSSSARPAK